MKFRCPYCGQMIGTESRPTCPHCGKTMTIPGHLRKTSCRREKSRGTRSSLRSPSSSLLPGLQFGRKPSNIFIALAVMIVVGGILIGRAGRRFPSPMTRSPEVVAAKELRVLRIALEQFRGDCRRYPETDEGLKALIINPGVREWKGPYVNLIKPDPWKHHYCYSFDNGEIMLVSYGPDGIEGTPDDLLPEEP